MPIRPNTTITNGMIAGMVRLYEILATEQATKTFTPNGGVIIPSVWLTTIWRSSPSAKFGNNATLNLPGALAQSVCANAAPTEPMWDAELTP